MRKYAVCMHLPEDKLPGFYAQLVKALASRARIFDRDKELLIVEEENEQEAVIDVLERFKVTYDSFTLRMLPQQAEVSDLFSDYGFVGKSGHPYLYEHLTVLFRFVDQAESGQEQEQALQQMEEHLIARYSDGDIRYYAADAELEPLMHGIARAYRCVIETNL